MSKSAMPQLSDLSLATRGRWHTLGAAVLGTWALIGCAVMIARHFGAPISWWVAVHSFTLGVITTAIVIYSTHFVEALTRTGASGFRGVAARVVMVQVGLVLLIVGKAGYDWGALADFAATLVILAIMWQMWFAWTRLRGSLAGRFAVTVPYYLVAGGFLVIAGLLGNFGGRGVWHYPAMIAAHSRAAIWGFAWLTVLGTVITLLPTLSSTRISAQATQRCIRALWVFATSLSLVILAHLLSAPLWAGMLQLVVVVAAVMVINPVIAAMLGDTPRWTAAVLSVTAGLLWLCAVCAADALSVLLGADPRATTYLLIPAFLGGGLLQLVFGVLHHLLPTLVAGGREKVMRARALADYAGLARVVLVNVGALLSILSLLYPARVAGLVLLALGLASHLVFLLIATINQHRRFSVQRTSA